jgi:hypothetical protein
VIDISTRKPTVPSDSLDELVRKVETTNSPIEKGRALLEMQERTGLTVLELSKCFKKSAMWAYNFLYLARLTEAVAALVEEKVISLGVAREIGRVVPVTHQMDILNQVRNMRAGEAKRHIAKQMQKIEKDAKPEEAMGSEEITSPPPRKGGGGHHPEANGVCAFVSSSAGSGIGLLAGSRRSGPVAFPLARLAVQFFTQRLRGSRGSQDGQASPSHQFLPPQRGPRTTRSDREVQRLMYNPK